MPPSIMRLPLTSVVHREWSATMTLILKWAALQDQLGTFTVRHDFSSFSDHVFSIKDSGRYPMPMGGAYSQYPPPLPPPRRGPRSVASSRQSSQYSAPHMPYYPYPPGMMAAPFPYGYPLYAVSGTWLVYNSIEDIKSFIVTFLKGIKMISHQSHHTGRSRFSSTSIQYANVPPTSWTLPPATPAASYSEGE